MGQARWTIYPAQDFDKHATAWDRCNSVSGDIPFMRAAFIRHALGVFGRGDEILAIRGTSACESALLILKKSRFGTYNVFQPSQLPLGAVVRDPTLPLQDLARELFSVLPGTPIMIGFTQQDPAHTHRPDGSETMETLDYVETGWVDVQGSFADYWESRGKNLRQNVRKQRAKLESDRTYPTLDVITHVDGVNEAIEHYGALESSGWKGAAATAVSAGNDQGRFYRAMLEEFCSVGAGRIYQYRFGRDIVAMDLCVESGNTQVILKTTYDQSYKSISPSTLMRQESFREVFDRGNIRRIEFYGKLMEWHTRWTDNHRMLYHANVFRWGSARRVRKWLRRGENLLRNH